MSHARVLIPPTNWGLTERGLSRSGLPSTINLAFLAKQKIRTIVYLAAEDEEVNRAHIEPELLQFLTDQQMQLIQLGGAPDEVDGHLDSGSKDRDSKPTHMTAWKPTSEELVLSALTHILDPKLFPLHLMCSSSGRHLTGVVVGCFRKLQRWSLSSIFAEYRRYAGGAAGARGAEDWGNQLVRNEQFIELFDVELLAGTIGQRALAKHMKQLNIAVAPAAAAAAASLVGSNAAVGSKDMERKHSSASVAPNMRSIIPVISSTNATNATVATHASAPGNPSPARAGGAAATTAAAHGHAHMHAPPASTLTAVSPAIVASVAAAAPAHAATPAATQTIFAATSATQAQPATHTLPAASSATLPASTARATGT